MTELNDIAETGRCTKVAVVGMGYVGLPLAVEFAKKIPTTGFDINEEKIRQYQDGKDPTGELGTETIRGTDITFTADPEKLKEANVFIVAVPTPVHEDKTLDLAPLMGASRLVGSHMPAGSLVVYESTVYPGATEDVCIPILEESSGMTAGTDFLVGYSPERINPGDREHTLTSTVKIVSGQNSEALERVADVYSLIFEDREGAGIYRAKSMKVAEAAKVVENSQRDVNIAFMNEVAQIMHRVGVDTIDVLKAMNTKWNALGFRPGLVGGHCISVDPYYLIQEAEKSNYHANLLVKSREINEDIPVMVAQETIRQLSVDGRCPARQAVCVAGLSFKGNVSDLRNSKAKRIVDTLDSYGMQVEIADPHADAGEAARMFGRRPMDVSQIRDVDCLIVAAAHSDFAAWTAEDFGRMMKETGAGLIVDVCNLFSRDAIEGLGYRYWSL